MKYSITIATAIASLFIVGEVEARKINPQCEKQEKVVCPIFFATCFCRETTGRNQISISKEERSERGGSSGGNNNNGSSSGGSSSGNNGGSNGGGNDGGSGGGVGVNPNDGSGGGGNGGGGNGGGGNGGGGGSGGGGSDSGKNNKGHGNNVDGFDPDNPGKGTGAHRAPRDNTDDEKGKVQNGNEKDNSKDNGHGRDK